MKERETALLALDKVYGESAFLEDILSPKDKFARHLALGVLKNGLYLDHCIEKYSNIKLKKIHRPIKFLIKMGIYELFYMDTKDHAVINETVELAKKYGNRGSANFVNAILRAIQKKGLPSMELKDAKSLSIFYSHPLYFVEEILENKGLEFTKALLKYNNGLQKFYIRTNTFLSDDEEILRELKSFGIKKIKENVFEIENPEGIFYSNSFKNGHFYAQDISSTEVSKILNPKRGQRVLDLCASPGGKATHLAALLEGSERVVACDISNKKIDRIIENKERLGAYNLVVTKNDATLLNEKFLKSFDKILLDAPCSATGLFGKKPEIRYKRTVEDIKNLSEIQYKMLKNAIEYLKLGGELIYSTCSLTKSENEQVIQKLLKENSDIEVLPIYGEATFKIYPNIIKGDGFSMTKLKKIR